MHWMSPLIALSIAFAACLTAVVPGEAQSAASADAAASLMLHPGDVVRITVWRKPELSGDFPIAADGSIADPFYMEVQIAGIAFPGAAERVRNHVARYETDPRVLVEPLFRVSVGGEVRQPNLYSLRPETTIFQAVMQAGGPTALARIGHVRIWRGGQELTVDLTRPDAGLASTPIRSGDQIVIPRQVSVVRDYIAPISSILGAAIAMANFILRYR